MKMLVSSVGRKSPGPAPFSRHDLTARSLAQQASRPDDRRDLNRRSVPCMFASAAWCRSPVDMPVQHPAGVLKEHQQDPHYLASSACPMGSYPEGRSQATMQVAAIA